MIVGIGIDLCDGRRIERSMTRFGAQFLNRIFTDIEIVSGPLGKPEVLLHGGAQDVLRSRLHAGQRAHIHLSLSDEPPYATAYAVIEAI